MKWYQIGPWLADFGHGILITILLLILYDKEPDLFYFSLGLVFSILPDLDGVVEFLRYRKVDAGEHGDHRDGLHYPVVWIVAGGILIFIEPFIGTLFTLCVLAHFLNDSWGTGWGIEWLWPLSHRTYKFFSRSDRADDVTLKQLLVSWDTEGREYAAKYLAKRNWLDDIYGRMTLISSIEYGAFVLSLVVLAIYLL